MRHTRLSFPWPPASAGWAALLLGLVVGPATVLAQPPPPPGPVCTNFDDGQANGWTAEHATLTFPATHESYALLGDDQGASNLVAPKSLLGNLNQRYSCGQFCFDVNLFANGPTPPANQFPSVSFFSGSTVATFNASAGIQAGSGWHRQICAPLSLVGAGQPPPSNASGSWQVSPNNTGTAWNALIINVTALKLKVDWGNPLPQEQVGYDNLCFVPGTCPQADFTFTPGCAGASTSFTSTSTGANSFAWTFPGGNPATASTANPASIFAAAGAHAVTLCINGGTTAPLCVTKTVTTPPSPPPPVINGPVTACTSPATYCVNPANAALGYAWGLVPAASGTITPIPGSACVKVDWATPNGGVVTVEATNRAGCKSMTRLLVQPCTSLGDCCHCNDLSVRDEKLVGSTFTAALTAAPMPVTRVAVDLISTTVVPNAGCGTAGPRASQINSGTLAPGFATGVLPVPSSRDITFTSSSPLGVSLNPGALSLNLALPPTPTPFWCGDSLSFCLKYSFTGRDCKTCELIECYGPYPRGGIIVVDPGPVFPNRPFDLHVMVLGEDGNPNPGIGGKLIVRLKPRTEVPAARLSGGTRTALVGGVATFSGLAIDRPGEGFVLTVAIDDGSAPIAETAPFSVQPAPR